MQPLSGFRDYRSQTKDFLIERLKRAYQLFGYEFLETPALEREEILLGKMGDEAQKLLYLFEDNGERKVGLRYDLTVPLSRFVAGNLGQLPLPYKRYEIGPVWRAERPQKGRYRQFWQADVDIVGAEEPAAEIELIELIDFVAKDLNVNLECRVNDRRVLDEIFEKIGVKDTQRALIILDKKDKLSEEAIDKELKTLGLSDIQLRQLDSIFFSEGENMLEKVEELLGESTATENLRTILEKANRLDLNVVFYPSMVRGLDYYTGFIVECVVEGTNGPSVVGGGRYDDLVDKLSGTKLPAVGISFGVDRLVDYLENAELVKTERLFIVNLPEVEDVVREWADELRLNGKVVELYLDSAVEMGKQIKYADKKGYREIIIPLESEWKAGKVAVKNLETGSQKIAERKSI